MLLGLLLDLFLRLRCAVPDLDDGRLLPNLQTGEVFGGGEGTGLLHEHLLEAIAFIFSLLSLLKHSSLS